MILEWGRTAGMKMFANCDLWLCTPPQLGSIPSFASPLWSLLSLAISKDQCFIVLPSEEAGLQCWVKQVEQLKYWGLCYRKGSLLTYFLVVTSPIFQSLTSSVHFITHTHKSNTNQDYTLFFKADRPPDSVTLMQGCDLQDFIWYCDLGDLTPLERS